MAWCPDRYSWNNCDSWNPRWSWGWSSNTWATDHTWRWDGWSCQNNSDGWKGSDVWQGWQQSELSQDGCGSPWDSSIKINNTTTLGGTRSHCLKREHRLILVHGIFAKCHQQALDSAGAGTRPTVLPQVTTSQWGCATVDAVLFMLTRASPKTPLRSLQTNPAEMFNLDACAALMAEAFHALHRDGGCEVLDFIKRNCYNQGELMQAACSQGFTMLEEYQDPRANTPKSRQDWRRPSVFGPGAPTMLGGGLHAPVLRPTVESTEEELERLEKRRRIAELRLGEQQALLREAQLSSDRSDQSSLARSDVSTPAPRSQLELLTQVLGLPRTRDSVTINLEDIRRGAEAQQALLQGGQGVLATTTAQSWDDALRSARKQEENRRGADPWLILAATNPGAAMSSTGTYPPPPWQKQEDPCQKGEKEQEQDPLEKEHQEGEQQEKERQETGEKEKIRQEQERLEVERRDRDLKETEEKEKGRQEQERLEEMEKEREEKERRDRKKEEEKEENENTHLEPERPGEMEKEPKEKEDPEHLPEEGQAKAAH